MAENPSVELNPKRLKTILDEAPVMDVQKTVVYLESRITPFNEISVTPADRLKLLEIFHDAYDEILISYDDLRLNTLPISPKERKAVSLDIMWLYLHLAMGYKILVKQHADQAPGYLKDKFIVLAIYRAMELIINALLHTFRAHESPPPLAYLELHQLYNYAARLNIADSKIRQINSIHGHPSIADLYKQFLLLVIVDPFRQVSNSIFEIFLIFEEHAHHAVLSIDSIPKQNTNTCFMISVMEDSPPVKCDKTLSFETEHIYLDISAVIKSLKQSTENINPENFTQSSEIRLVEVIISQLSHTGKRREERTSCNQKVKIWFGMDATRYFLQSPDNLKNALQVETHQGIEVSNLDSEEAGEYELSDYTVANHSRHGFYLTGKQLDDIDLAGDITGLVGIVEPVDVNKPKSLLPELALIRWERGAENGELQIGVERIEGIAHTMCISNDNNNETLPGLFFTPADHPSRISYILLPTPIYKEKQKLKMVINQKSIPITLGAKVIKSSKYTVCRLAADKA